MFNNGVTPYATVGPLELDARYCGMRKDCELGKIIHNSPFMSSYNHGNGFLRQHPGLPQKPPQSEFLSNLKYCGGNVKSYQKVEVTFLPDLLTELFAISITLLQYLCQN